MGTQDYANGSVVYTSEEDANRMCVDSLKDDAHYRFQCRCGCKAQFAGYGKDIKAAAKIGGNFKPVPVLPPVEEVLTTTESADVVWVDAEPRELEAVHTVEDVVDIADASVLESEEREEAAEKPRPYVSDRYLKKAQFDLSDDEIDAYQGDRPDDLELQGFAMSLRQPPAIGDLVYSISSNVGPFSLVEYTNTDVRIGSGNSKRVLSGLVRGPKGKYQTFPLADLDVYDEDTLGVVSPTSKSAVVVLTVLSLLSAICGSAFVISLFL